MDSSHKRSRFIEDKFVTVVSVEEDNAAESSHTDQQTHKLDSDFVLPTYSAEGGQDIRPESPASILTTTEENEKSEWLQQRPQPAPRQFVTVVSVGGTERIEMGADGNAILESNLKVRLDVSQEDEKGENQESPVVRHHSQNGVTTKVGEKMQTSTTESRVPDQVIVFRLPGERLGLGLKFDGGMGATEKVRRLFIQSVAPDSPAARATVPWGDLEVGDQIFHIEGRSVSSMTRVECVSLLKEASVKLTIGVLKGNGNIPEPEYGGSSSSPSSQTRFNPYVARQKLKRVPPPPLPPRLRPRKSPARPPKETTEWPPLPNGFEDFDGDESPEKMSRANRTNIFPTDDWDGEVTALMAPHSSRPHRLPPTPAVYLDLLSEEDRASRARCESESDETNSSASTVVDRLSISSSRTVSRNSSFNAAADAAKFDLARALSPFEQLEKEMNSEKKQRSLSTPHLTSNELISCVMDSAHMDEPSVESELPNGENDIVSDAQSTFKCSPKTKVKSTMKSLPFSLKSHPFWHNDKHSNEEKSSKVETQSSKKSNKRQAPLPPPRSLSSITATSNSARMSNVASSMVGFSVRDKSEYVNITDECDDNEFGDVFEKEDFPSIVEKTTGKQPGPASSDLTSSSRVVGSSLLDSILRETKSRLENMTEKVYPFAYEEGDRNESFEQTVAFGNESRETLNTIGSATNEIYFAATLKDDNGKVEPMADSSFSSSPRTDGDGSGDNSCFGGEDEPLNTETYELKKEFLIDRVSNPSYGFPPLSRECETILSPTFEPEEDELYEDVNASPVNFILVPPVVSRAESPERGREGNGLEHLRGFSDISSPSSRSQSSVFLSSRKVEETSSEELKGEIGQGYRDIGTGFLKSVEDHNKQEDPPPLPIYSESLTSTVEEQSSPPNDMSVVSDEVLQDKEDYEYVDVFTPPLEREKNQISSLPKRIYHTSSQVRLREDIGQLLREELSLGKDAHVEVEEEEIVESVVECETEEELLLVLRALRSDNSLSLDEQ